MLAAVPVNSMTSKRKAPDENPLLANKRTKHEKDKAMSKRKIPNGEEQPGGLVIVRAPSLSQDVRPPSRQQSIPVQPQSTNKVPRSGSQPPSASQPQPSSSKVSHPIASSSQPIHSRARDVSLSQTNPSSTDKDVRSMDDESDHHRRQSRARAIPSALRANNWQEEPPPAKAGASRRDMSVDITEPLPTADSPVIERNKAMRHGAMVAINGEDTPRQSQTPQSPKTPVADPHLRRSSLGARGHRIRVSIESAGAIMQPHNSVTESSFYKHIPADLPDADRMRLLLSWCTTRVMNTPPDKSLPKLSVKGTSILQAAQEKMLRLLSEKQVDTRTSASQDDSTLPKLKNEQNESNRRFEVTYTAQIRAAEKEDEAWKNAIHSYDSYFRKRQAQLEETLIPMSAKSRGKQKATAIDDALDDWQPESLPDRFKAGLAFARSVVKSSPDPSLQQGLKDLEFNVDTLNDRLSRTRAIANIADRAISARFTRLAAEANMEPSHLPGTSLLTDGTPDTDPRELLQALVRVDSQRPLAKVGDAARRAAREVQRIEEKGIEALGERRLTGVPPTPRTPRRGSTPGRERQ